MRTSSVPHYEFPPAEFVARRIPALPEDGRKRITTWGKPEKEFRFTRSRGKVIALIDEKSGRRLGLSDLVTIGPKGGPRKRITVAELERLTRKGQKDASQRAKATKRIQEEYYKFPFFRTASDVREHLENANDDHRRRPRRARRQAPELRDLLDTMRPKNEHLIKALFGDTGHGKGGIRKFNRATKRGGVLPRETRRKLVTLLLRQICDLLTMTEEYAQEFYDENPALEHALQSAMNRAVVARGENEKEKQALGSERKGERRGIGGRNASLPQDRWKNAVGKDWSMKALWGECAAQKPLRPKAYVIAEKHGIVGYYRVNERGEIE